MKTLRRIQLLSLLLIVTLFTLLIGLLFPQSVRAEKMNEGTQDIVVSKLNRVLENMDHKDPSWLPTQQRLADVLAERARSRSMQEIEASCDGCKGSKEDRKQAIKIYETILNELPLKEHGSLLFQLGHLYEMVGDSNKAINLFEQIIKDAKSKSIPAGIVSRSRAELGDLLYKKNRFKDALDNYVYALKDKTLENKALVIYNMGWCEFNTDKLNSAIATFEGLLKKPEQIIKDTESGSKYDSVLHTDIVRDLGAFYSRRDISNRDINAYEAFSPSDQRKDLLLNFGMEADRVGQKQAAHDILTRYLQLPNLTKAERLDAFVRLAQINYDRGEVSESIKDFAKASQEFKNSDCGDNNKCQALQKTMKRYVTELHRSKKVKPDQDTLNAYVTYIKTFPQDKEMIQRGSQVAADLNRFQEAIMLYRGISENESFSKAEQNEALLNEITVAEKSQDPKLQEEAYNHFLKYASKDEKHFQVRYQRAYLLYTNKQLKEATESFNDLAHDKTGSADLRKKAADLALDSLAQLKQDETLRDLANEYAELMPTHKSEFLAVARKALMNQVARIANNPNSTKTELKSVMKAVLKTSLDTASPKERQLIYTNLSIVAIKLHDDDVFIKSLYALINLPELDEKQRIKYMEQLIGFHERKLEFKPAYQIALHLDNKKTSAMEQEFRLGTLADLAEDKELDASKHYKKALDLGLKGERAFIVRSRIVLLSNSPAKELKSQSLELRKKPALLNELTLLVLAKNENAKELKSILAMKELKNKSADRVLQKQELYAKVEAFKESISKLHIEKDSDQAMQKSIQQWIKQIAKSDENLNKAVALKDITAELMTLNIMAEENMRIVHELAKLDVPQGLTADQKRQYFDALKMKSRPFLAKAKIAQNRIQEIWSFSKGLAELAQEYKMARPEIKKLLDKEMQILEQIPGKGPMKNLIQQAKTSSDISNSALSSARKNVSENPENIKDLNNLKLIEIKIGHPLMPSYLEARINNVQKGKSL